MSEVRMEAMDSVLGKLLMKGLMAGSETDSAPDRGLPVPEQVARLRDLRARYDVQHTFEPGDFVRLKDGLGLLKDNLRPHIALMYWRPLDVSDPQDMEIMRAQNKKTGVIDGAVNCMTVHICNDGHCLIHVAMNTRELEPWDPDA